MQKSTVLGPIRTKTRSLSLHTCKGLSNLFAVLAPSEYPFLHPGRCSSSYVNVLTYNVKNKNNLRCRLFRLSLQL